MSMMVTETSYLPGNRLKLRIRPCPVCKIPHELVVDEYKFDEWCDGVLSMETAFPELTPAERELLLTGIDDACYPHGEEGGEEE